METCRAEEKNTLKKVAYLSINDTEFADKVEIDLGKRYECKVEDGKIFFTKKKTLYPSSFEDCCKILSIKYRWNLQYSNPEVERGNTILTYEKETIDCFLKLRICLLAYWRLADNWKPDWSDNYQKKYTIAFYQDEISLVSGPNVHRFLAFPTDVMRDEFYYHFSDIIMKCKHLI